jgi:hypothetical protein
MAVIIRAFGNSSHSLKLDLSPFAPITNIFLIKSLTSKQLSVSTIFGGCGNDRVFSLRLLIWRDDFLSYEAP